MNVKEYIQSGIVETYLLGLATEAERQEFEQTCADYPEVAAARDAVERQLEQQLLKDAVAPPPFLRERIVGAMQPDMPDNGAVYVAPETPVRRLNGWKWLAAASLLLLAGAGYWAFITNARNNDLVARQQAMEKDLAEKNNELAALKTDREMLFKPGMKMVSLRGMPDAPGAFSTVYWDTTGTTKDVYLMVNNLPQPPSDKQYQLWALLDGTPIDLGVFDYNVRQNRLLFRMKNVQNAQAFAITLEKRGGNPTPEGKPYVMGNL